MMSLRLRYATLTGLVLITVLLSTYFFRTHLTLPILTPLDDANTPLPDTDTPPPTPIDDTPPPLPPPPIYKPTPLVSAVPIVDNFPLAAAAHSATDLPPLSSWNGPPKPHAAEKTPLFIGFTCNWRLLQQVVVSYITSGWPAEDIYVVENTGVMDANARSLLSLQNPFFLNHTRLEMLGVNVLVTPTLFTFAQLQNFYIWTATDRGWEHYFWSHMDVAILSLESAARFPPSGPNSLTVPESEEWETHTLYDNCLQALRNVKVADPTTGKIVKWASIFFSYDRLALNNVAAFKSVGAWDTMIPFYMTDCDMHARLTMGGYEIFERKAGIVYDVASSLSDLVVLYRQKSGPGGKIGEAGWIDPNILEAEREAEVAALEQEDAKAGDGEKKERKIANAELEKADKQERPPKEGDEEKQNETWALAALFAPQPITAATAKPQPKAPDPSKWTADAPASSSYHHLLDILDKMQGSKGSSPKGRNTWQARTTGGQTEPFYRDSAGFEKVIQLTIEHGRAVYREKWGHRDCDIYEVGLRAGDAWRVERDWV